MPQFTPQATSHLVRVRQERGLDEKQAARFIRRGTGVGLTFAPKPQPGDTEVDVDGIDVYMASDVAAKLDKAVIDARDEGGKEILVLRPASAARKS